MTVALTLSRDARTTAGILPLACVREAIRCRKRYLARHNEAF
jgi:hypothetical protein